MWAMDMDPRKRPQSAQDFVEALGSKGSVAAPPIFDQRSTIREEPHPQIDIVHNKPSQDQSSLKRIIPAVILISLAILLFIYIASRPHPPVEAPPIQPISQPQRPVQFQPYPAHSSPAQPSPFQTPKYGVIWQAAMSRYLNSNISRISMHVI